MLAAPPAIARHERAGHNWNSACAPSLSLRRGGRGIMFNANMLWNFRDVRYELQHSGGIKVIADQGMTQILIVDDEESIQRLLMRILSWDGYNCSVAGDAAEARTLMKGQNPDLILCDVGLPGESGIAFIRYVLAEHPETAVVMVSARDDPEIADTALQMGAYGYIVKPFKPNEVLINVNNAIRRRKLEIKNRFQRENLEKLVEERTRELKETQKELVNTAMEAGRVQLSAMVLHNIGNAITPIKVQVEEMKSKQLEQIGDYLEKCYLDLNEHARDLQQYVNVNPRGKEVFSYMGNLIEALKAFGMQNKNLADKLDQTVAYISEILTLQQAYAASNLEIKENTDLNMILEDAIRMQKSALEKRGICLKKDLDHNLPKLLIDKSRLMQVIVNIIINSYEAIDELNDKDKVINLKTFSENGKVGLKITDSGIGIEPDKIDTIFEFGKSHKGSSGFGLYYCRMFVDANQGVLTLRSPGKGKGATVEILFET